MSETMSKTIINVLAVLPALLLASCGGPPAHEPADIVLRQAYVYTADGDRNIARALAIRGNEIVFVGSDEDAEAWIGQSTGVRDLQGAMIMPGLHDMHIHAVGIVEPDMCDLQSEPRSFEQLVPVLRECIARYGIAEGEWLIALQWPFSRGNEPSDALPHIRAALDAVSTDHPIFLWGDDGHHGAANSLALAMATTPDGDNVEIDAESLATVYSRYRPMIGVDEYGEPTGGINEDARLLIRPDFLGDMLGMAGDLAAVMPRVAGKLAASGITSIQDAIVTPNTLAAYAELEKSGGMTFRLRAAMVEPPSEEVDRIDDYLAGLAETRAAFADSRLIEASAVKLFADGVLEGNPLTDPPTLPVAATLENFKQPLFAGNLEDGTFDVVGYVDTDSELCRSVRADQEHYRPAAVKESFRAEYGYYPQQCIASAGVLEHEESFIRSYIRKATEAGFHVHVHALSDKAVRIAVDEFARVKPVADDHGTTQSLAHVQLAHPDDQRRIGELGVYVVFTFVWATPGIQYDMMVAPFIDEIDGVANLYDPDSYYMQNVYPARSIQAAGGIPVNGSDAPVGSRDPMPFASLQQAVYRGNGEQVLNADERLDIHSAIAAFTINGARMFRHADTVGSLEVGKAADLIALSQNIVELAESGRADEISNTRVTLTIFDGRVVYDAATEGAGATH